MMSPLRQRSTTPDPSAAWMISLADLLALLLAFFVLLFSMSEIKVDRWQTVNETLGNRMSDTTDLVTQAGDAERNMAMIFEQKAMDLAYLEHILNGKKAQSPLLDNVEIFKADGRLVVSIGGSEFFRPGTNKEEQDVAQVIRMIGATLQHISNRIEVFGHTDPEPIMSPTARYADNWALSLARALSVANELMKAGYSRPIRAFGLADSRFDELAIIADRDKKYALARRVDIVISAVEG